jgi:hypothetical protein
MLLILKHEKGNPNNTKKKLANLIKFSGAVKIALKKPGMNSKRIIIFLLKYKNKSLLKIIFNKINDAITNTDGFARYVGKITANSKDIINRVSSELFFITIIIYIPKKINLFIKNKDIIIKLNYTKT